MSDMPPDNPYPTYASVEPPAEYSAPDEPQPPKPPPTRKGWRRFVSWVPYTTEFETRISEIGSSYAQTRIYTFNSLTLIDDELRKNTAITFNEEAANLSRAESWIDAAKVYSVVVILMVAIAAFLIGPQVAVKFVHPLAGWTIHGFLLEFAEFALGLGTALVACVILMLPFFLVPAKAQDFFDVDLLLLSWATAFFLIAVTYLYGLQTGKIAAWPVIFRSRLFFYFLVQVGFAGPLFMMAVMATRLFDNILERRRRKLHPRAIIIDELLWILAEIQKTGYEFTWLEFSYRRSLCQKLEVIASCIDYQFGQYFMTGVTEMDRWINRTTSEMANGIRQLIKWVATPNPHTREDLRARLIKYFTAALASEWGKFERVSPEELSRKRGMKERLLSSLTAVAAAVLPFIFLLLLRKSGVTIAEPLSTYLTVGSYIWAVLSLLARLDPQYAAKLGALTDIRKLLPGRKGGDGGE